VQEVLLYHKASKTCIVADIVENMTEEWVVESGTSSTCFGRWVLSFIDFCFHELVGRSGPSPDWQLHLTGDVAEIRATVAEVTSWDFDALLLCHGELIEQDAKVALLRTLAELMTMSEKRSPCWVACCARLGKWR